MVLQVAPGWGPQEWSAFGTCITAIVAVLAGLVALSQLGESRKLRREQAQPYVAVFMEESAASQHVVDLVIKNFGNTAAFDVEIFFDPWPRRSASDQGGKTEEVTVPKALGTLVPGQEWRTFWDSGPSRARVELPDEYCASVTFYDEAATLSAGWWRPGKKRRRKYSFDFKLDFGLRKNVEFIRVLKMHDAVKELQAINQKVDRRVLKARFRGK